jgi:hypothetical protein
MPLIGRISNTKNMEEARRARKILNVLRDKLGDLCDAFG